MSLLLVACGTGPKDVPSLGATPTPAVEQAPLDDEARVMAFVQCMREEGVELQDPVVDADGNVQQSDVIGGATLTREAWAAPYDVCGHYIEGISFGAEREDTSTQLDTYVALAGCLREKGYDVEEPTAETFGQWRKDFRVEFNWDDPEAQAVYEACAGD